MTTDVERRSRLLSLKLRALVREHLGITTEPEGTSEHFGLGSAFLTSDAVWLIVDGDASRACGPCLAWAAPKNVPIHILVEQDSGLLARRVELFNVDATVWQIRDRTLLRAVSEPHLEHAIAASQHLAFTEMIAGSGAEVVVEHGVVVGEVRGLEMCRVVDDLVDGSARLEVGMGAHDREAFLMVHGNLPTEKALSNVIEAVEPLRSEGADLHPLNQFGRERLHRWRAIQNPQSIGFVSLRNGEPPVKRTNVKDAVPCVATGITKDGEESIAVFVHGIDLDVISFAVDAADRLHVDSVTVVLRKRDVIASIERLASLAKVHVEIAHLVE